MRIHPQDLPSRREEAEKYYALLDDYEELLEYVWGYKLRAWGDIHQMTLDKIQEMKEKIDDDES